MTNLLRLVGFGCVGMAGLVAGAVRADELMPMDQSPSKLPGAADGKYGGVTPGANASNPLPKPPGGPPHLIWTGFQPTAAGSRVFLQTTAPVEFEVKEGHVSRAGHSTMSVLLRGCRIHMANNRRKLDTRAFATPVQSISAKQRRNDIELLINLREPASATPGTESGPNGSRFLLLDFPPGKPAPIEEKPPARADSASSAATSGEGWSLSGVGDSVQAEPKEKAKPRGRGRAVPAFPVQAETTPAGEPSPVPAQAK